MIRLFLVAISLLIAAPSWAAIAFVQSKQAAGMGTNSVTFDSQPSAGNLVAVVVPWLAFLATLDSMTDTCGNTYTLAVREDDDTVNGYHKVDIWYSQNISTCAPFTVTATFAGVRENHVAILEYSGIAKTDALDSINSNQADSSTTPTSGAVVPTGNALYLAAVTSGSGEGVFTVTEDGGWALRHENENQTNRLYSAIDKIASGSQNAGWTFGQADYFGAVIAAFKELSVRRPTTPVFFP